MIWVVRLELNGPAYYGQMKLSDIAELAKYGKPLWHKNIRYYKGDTEVNEGMEATLLNNPERFWYFNNGITILCRKLNKTPLNGSPSISLAGTPRVLAGAGLGV